MGKMGYKIPTLLNIKFFYLEKNCLIEMKKKYGKIPLCNWSFKNLFLKNRNRLVVKYNKIIIHRNSIYMLCRLKG